MSVPRVKPFPFNRLERLDSQGLDLMARLDPSRVLPAISQRCGLLAREAGLGGAGIEPYRVQLLKMEELRVVFPGTWQFFVFADSLSQRSGFLGLDPLLFNRMTSLDHPERTARPGITSTEQGDRGLLAYWCCRTLDELSGVVPGVENWRYHGMFESTGQLGRYLRSQEKLFLSWFKVQLGWDTGFAVWVEGESSIDRRGRMLDCQFCCPPDLSSVPVGLRQVVGQVDLLPGEIEALSEGDVVLLSRLEPARSVALRADGICLCGIRALHGFRLMSIEQHEGGMELNKHKEESLDLDDLESTLDVSRIPVVLTADAGRVELTVAQLAGLRVGDVLTLPAATLDSLDLRAGERLVARGELVDVDGRRGVRIVETGWRPGVADEDGN